VRNGAGDIKFSGILSEGEAYDIPVDSSLSLKVGNAGGLVLEQDGERFGPFGGRGVVMRRIALDRSALAGRFAEAPTETTVQ
jgi:hypothetical protein